jgi:hypothetical protein
MIEPPENDAGALQHAPGATEFSIVESQSDIDAAIDQLRVLELVQGIATHSFEVALEIAEINDVRARSVLRETPLAKWYRSRFRRRIEKHFAPNHGANQKTELERKKIRTQTQTEMR